MTDEKLAELLKRIAAASEMAEKACLAATSARDAINEIIGAYFEPPKADPNWFNPDWVGYPTPIVDKHHFRCPQCYRVLRTLGGNTYYCPNPECPNYKKPVCFP